MRPSRRKGDLSIFDPKIIRQAVIDSFTKLNPRVQAKNPVMFVVEVGSVVTTIEFIRLLFTAPTKAFPASSLAAETIFVLAVTIWLWFTVLFANFAEAMAEGRGKAQAATLRQTRTTAVAKRLANRDRNSKYAEVSAPDLRKGDLVLVEAGDAIPGDGEVVEGVASVDESAITGESAPVIRESGGDRSAVTGGTRVLSDWIIVQITANPGETFLDRMIARQPDNHLRAGLRVAGTLCHLFRPGGFDHNPDRASGLLDPNNHWWSALRHWYRGHGPYGTAQCAGNEWTRG